MKVLNLEKTCTGCPTVFEWNNKKGENIYFRLRYGYAKIVNESKDIEILADYFPGADGICSWDEVVIWAEIRGIKLKSNI